MKVKSLLRAGLLASLLIAAGATSAADDQDSNKVLSNKQIERALAAAGRHWFPLRRSF